MLHCKVDENTTLSLSTILRLSKKRLDPRVRVTPARLETKTSAPLYS